MDDLSVIAPRLPLVTEPTDEVREYFAKTKLRDGHPYNVMRALAHHPMVLQRLNALGGVYATHSTIPLRVREIVVLRVAGRAGCGYQLAAHAPVARSAGLDEREVERIVGGGQLDDPGEQALLALADELHSSDDVSDATWAVLSADWGPADLVELVTLAGFYRLLAGFLNVMRVPVDG
jgi:4-carboxymuconolactone decarboxylase